MAYWCAIYYRMSPNSNSKILTITLSFILIRRLPSVYRSHWLQEKFRLNLHRLGTYVISFLIAFSHQNRCVRGSAKLQKDFMRATRTLYICNPAAKHFENHRRTHKADSSVSLYVLINYEVFDQCSSINTTDHYQYEIFFFFRVFDIPKSPGCILAKSFACQTSIVDSLDHISVKKLLQICLCSLKPLPWPVTYLHVHLCSSVVADKSRQETSCTYKKLGYMI